MRIGSYKFTVFPIYPSICTFTREKNISWWQKQSIFLEKKMDLKNVYWVLNINCFTIELTRTIDNKLSNTKETLPATRTQAKTRTTFIVDKTVECVCCLWHGVIYMILVKARVSEWNTFLITEHIKRTRTADTSGSPTVSGHAIDLTKL